MTALHIETELQPEARRPGWVEVAVGIVVTAAIGLGLGSQLHRLGLDKMSYGLILAAWSGLSCLIGFAAAWRVRTRPLASFGVRSTSRRWLLIGLAAGFVALLTKGLAVLGFMALTGITSSPQGVYGAAGSGGALSLVAATFLIGVLVPIGEELLFRGVVTTVLLRYGTLIGVVGGAVFFAVVHGINIVFPAALVLGLTAGEIYRRCGSIWPPVIVHVIYNLPTVPVMVLTGAA